MPTTLKNAAGETLQRLIIEYNVSDGCTYNCTNTVPVLYESGEAFLVDFEAWCKQHKDGNGSNADKFAGQEFSPYNFFEHEVFYAPNVYTVEEWFAEQEKHHKVTSTKP
jgi:hypothetical protein